LFYRNESQNVGDFLGLNLLLPVRGDEQTLAVFDRVAARNRTGGRPAIGATATVYLQNGRKLVSQVDGGNGHSGKRAPSIHFGLGRIPPGAKLKVELRWRHSDGRILEKTLSLLPGWHTVLLGL
jgi:enediyne biosynthesis protein E4